MKRQGPESRAKLRGGALSTAVAAVREVCTVLSGEVETRPFSTSERMGAGQERLLWIWGDTHEGMEISAYWGQKWVGRERVLSKISWGEFREMLDALIRCVSLKGKMFSFGQGMAVSAFHRPTVLHSQF